MTPSPETPETAIGEPEKPDTPTLSPDRPCAKMNGVTVDLGEFAEFIIDEETELAVEKLPDERDENDEWKIEAYDITLGDQSDLGLYITIRIPYDASFCDEGEDPANCVEALYKNEETGEWEGVPYEVDAEAGELVILTDHLSTYGAFMVKNENTRYAFIFGYDTSLYMLDETRAIAALNEQIDNELNEGRITAELGASLFAHNISTLAGLDLELWPNHERLSEGTSMATTAETILGALEDAINVSTLGDLADSASSLGTTAAYSVYQQLAVLGRLASAAKVGTIILNTERTDAQILELYKELGKLLLRRISSKALGLACFAVSILDYSVSQLFETSMARKKADINEVYLYFNDYYQGGPLDGTPDPPITERDLKLNGIWNARSTRDWRDVVIGILEEHAGDEEAVLAELEAEVDWYCGFFWRLDHQDWGQVMSAMPTRGGTRGENQLSVSTEAERAEMTQEYKDYLYRRLRAVVKSAETEMQRRTEEMYRQELIEMQDFLNQMVKININEEIAAGAASEYEGYTVRFADLSKNADKTSWSSRIEGSGQTTIYFSLIGYAFAGRPTQLQFFPPDADPDTAEPEFTRDFELLIPQTDVNIGFGAPTLDQLAGAYEGQTINHSIVITELNFPDWFEDKADLAAQETAEWNRLRQGKPFYEGSFEISKIDDTHGRISTRLLPGTYDFEYSPETGQIVSIGEHILDRPINGRDMVMGKYFIQASISPCGSKVILEGWYQYIYGRTGVTGPEGENFASCNTQSLYYEKPLDGPN
ncbi:MAG: hypothetical protein QM296_04940 [Bacillota bacterium]|nr:hypothetical protein [Bacillota bacterium]